VPSSRPSSGEGSASAPDQALPQTAISADEARVREAHGTQLTVYARALATLTGEPVTASLCLLADGRLVPITS
jgi:hypothetical protein